MLLFQTYIFCIFATMNSLKTLNPYFWKHRVLLFWGLLFIIASNFFAIYQVQFVGQSVDVIKSVLDKKNVDKELLFNTLLINGAIIVGTSVLSGVFRFMMRQTIIVASRRIEYELKNKIYRHYQELSLTTYKKTTIGDLLNRLSEDVVAIRMYLGKAETASSVLSRITAAWLIRAPLIFSNCTVSINSPLKEAT